MTTTFVLVDHADSSTSSESSAAAVHHDSVVVDVIPLHSGRGGGHYRPAAAATGARALHWLPLAAAVSATRALLGASHEDLRLRARQLSRARSEAFFVARATTCCPIGGGGAVRFPEGGLYVCADVQPLVRAVVDVQRALVRIAAEEASHGACDCFYDDVRDAMSQLVGDATDGRGPAVFDRENFEAAFGLQWVE
ncbi:hypothetical protein HU200_059945 [Digitaria exilis]|uniref:Uncharacterized protein n=1 Tax=Digitaria exilis TaxID=1010633 RepID=A0A835E0Y5_9POAL|nr:hypothetical protein HU200_059945 [Digitaria exilis]CAB3457128.1 unnamed protein product [Digitaria exilis]